MSQRPSRIMSGAPIEAMIAGLTSGPRHLQVHREFADPRATVVGKRDRGKTESRCGLPNLRAVLVL